MRKAPLNTEVQGGFWLGDALRMKEGVRFTEH